jgi:type VI secretion system secreted protein VgrG
LSCEIAGDPPSIKVTLPGDVSVELTKGKVRCQAGDVSTTMDGGGRLDVKVGDASMVFKKDGDVSLKCKQLKIDASSEIQMSAAGTVKIKGATVEIN